MVLRKYGTASRPKCSNTVFKTHRSQRLFWDSLPQRTFLKTHYSLSTTSLNKCFFRSSGVFRSTLMPHVPYLETLRTENRRLNRIFNPRLNPRLSSLRLRLKLFRLTQPLDSRLLTGLLKGDGSLKYSLTQASLK